ncbi:MAG: hypothetical protein JXA18_11380 [Chitinispirillaceae bacterium]|nr:hypothetical protein [Chitinispirillaceae bacterium]
MHIVTVNEKTAGKAGNRTGTMVRREGARSFRQFALFVMIAVHSSFSQVTYSGNWNERLGSGPWGDKLHISSAANATATIRDTGTEAFVIHRAGPEGGIFKAVVDGDQSTIKEVDTYAPQILWNKKTVIASDLPDGPHTIVVTVTGTKNPAASTTSVSIVDKWTLGRGMWSTEKAWAWYTSKPWIVGWNFTPTTCVNSMEWWQDEAKVTDSILHRELGIGEQLGYNAIVVYLQYLVWKRDFAYYKERFDRVLAIADSHHFTMTPVFFDDVNFICDGDDCGNSFLGDQGEPEPGKLMSQWTASPGPTYVLSVDERPGFKQYVQDFVRTYGQDERILMWNLYNEPGNCGIGARTFPLLELVFQWVREIGTSQPLTASEWWGYTNPWPYSLSDICSFHGYHDYNGLQNDVNQLRCTQRPIICTEWLARGEPGTNILIDLPLLKRLGVGAFCWSLLEGRMQTKYSWYMLDSYSDPWFHAILYNDGTPYRPEEVDAIRKNHAHKTFNWVAGATDGSMVVKNGCTDPRYAEYDSMATIDDGSCSTLLPPLVVRGCLDPDSKH